MKNKEMWSWVIYDWANSAFATTVMAGFFPLFFEKYWSNPDDVIQSTYQLGVANSLSSIIIAALSPFLGAIADQGSVKKKFLIGFCYLGIVMTGGLFLVEQGNWQLAVVLYIFATIGFRGSNTFYDSLLPIVSKREKVDYVSSLGFSIGYIGGGLLFLVNVMMYLNPEKFGFVDEDFFSLYTQMTNNNLSFKELKMAVAGLGDNYIELKTAFNSVDYLESDLIKKISNIYTSAQSLAIKTSFLMVAIWWAIFSLPLMIFIKEPNSEKTFFFKHSLINGLQELKSTFLQIKQVREAYLFLFAYWLYIDGVDTIISMAVKVGSSLGFAAADLITALLMVQFIAFPASFLYHRFSNKIGTKNAVFVGIGGYSVITLLGYFMSDKTHFFALAAMIGLFQGGIQALSRSLFSRLVPSGKEAEFFGFYNMVGKFAAVVGPFLLGWITVLTGNVRFGILSILILFLLGAYLLKKVDFEKGEQAALKLGKN
tara:strand:+ start:155 stop:1603 length:1449 start_codon:yes stop_codon:yes gene_type:complete